MGRDARLRIGVVGVGHLGRHHARILAGLDAVSLVGVVDIDQARADAVAADCGTRALIRVDQLLGETDAVTIAVPTEHHAKIALPFLELGTAVLVEKPLAGRIEDADQLIDAAQRSGAVLAVGHTERYNPAVLAASPLISSPRFVEVHRLSQFSARSLDIDVVFDLMIHDLDVVSSLVGSEVTNVEAVGVAVLSDRTDIANARLRFASGCMANLTASRISRDRVRKVRFFQPDSYVSIDCATQDVEHWRLVRRPGQPPAIDGGRLPVEKSEPLEREFLDFVEAVRGRRDPMVTGRDGYRAVVLAERITRAMEKPLS